MSYENIEVRTEAGKVGIVTLNRPKALNALNDPFVPASSLPQVAEAGPHVTLWQPAQGGHVGFPSAPFPGHVRAMPDAVTAFLAAQL